MRLVAFLSLTLFAASSACLLAAPRDFGTSELERALRDRKLPATAYSARMESGVPESFEIRGKEIIGGDDRGLMYGLLEAAEQIRSLGHLSDAKASPLNRIRGIRKFIHNADLERDWYYSKPYWDEFFGMLAKNRLNRFNLVFAHQTDYLAPPYPFWIELPEYPTIKARNLTPEQRTRNLEMLQYISQDAVGHGIDFTLGVWEHNIQDYRQPPMIPMTEGLTDENIGPYSYAALKKVLQLCPAISSVQMRTNNESGIHSDKQVAFYRDYVFRAIHDAGRPVLLDLRGWIVAGGMVKAAGQVNVPVRLSTKYWAEDLGRPYQPAETYPNYSYLNFLEKPRTYKFYWELWGLGSNRLLLWGDPDYVRRAASTFGLSGAEGFEIDPPLTQKGFGNAPGRWDVFTAANQERIFWKWDFERYWLFYRLWGRLSYDPAAPKSVWMDEMQRRFGAAAETVMDGYKAASRVINEIVAVHLADPNMYIWPEINPGGLIDSYMEVLPSDWSYVAGIHEAVHNRLTHTLSAKQTAQQTAAFFDDTARKIDTAVERARSTVPKGNREWASTEPDFRVLAHMARYHARKQSAAYALAFFDDTADAAALAAAKRELTAGLEIWRDLVKLTDGLYPSNMAFGPDDIGCWKDKLPYVAYDLELAKDRDQVLRQFGRFTAAFDFGGAVKSQPQYGAYRQDNSILQNNVEPRFHPVNAHTQYSEETGFGWLETGQRTEVPIPLTPYREMRAVSNHPHDLPHDVLFRDYIRGTGPQKFAVKLPDGSYSVTFLHPDHTTNPQTFSARNGRLEITFPSGDWSISGLVVKGGPAPDAPAWTEYTAPPPPPSFQHNPPSETRAGQSLTLQLQIANPASVKAVRLHYRPVDQLAKFKTLEAAPGAPFTIPGSDISSRWDLMYYFEVLNDAGSGWFVPNPRVETPYYVVKTRD